MWPAAPHGWLGSQGAALPWTMVLLSLGPVAAHLDPGRPNIRSEGSGLAHLMHNPSHASAETGRSRRPSPAHTGFEAAPPLEERHLPERDSQDIMGSPLVLLRGVLQPLVRMSDE
eukprot:242032-Pyramimonas_sp.AAC.1